MTIQDYLAAQEKSPKGRLAAPAEVVMELRRLTGIGVMDAKKALEDAQLSDWNGRFLKALLTQCGENGLNCLHDPIEDDPKLASIFVEAIAKTEKELEKEERRLGFCHLFWGVQQRILKEEYNIEWFTPARMNPWVFFD